MEIGENLKHDLMPYTLTKSGGSILQTVRTYEATRDARVVIENEAGATGCAYFQTNNVFRTFQHFLASA